MAERWPSFRTGWDPIQSTNSRDDDHQTRPLTVDGDVDDLIVIHASSEARLIIPGGWDGVVQHMDQRRWQMYAWKRAGTDGPFGSVAIHVDDLENDPTQVFSRRTQLADVGVEEGRDDGRYEVYWSARQALNVSPQPDSTRDGPRGPSPVERNFLGLTGIATDTSQALLSYPGNTPYGRDDEQANGVRYAGAGTGAYPEDSDHVGDAFAAMSWEFNGQIHASLISLYIIGTLPAVADFGWTQRPGTLTLDFRDKSANGPRSWDWDWDDGGANSDTRDPVKTYAQAGIYSVTLAVENPANDEPDYVTHIVSVMQPAPTASFVYWQPRASTALHFRDRSHTRPTSWLWEVYPDADGIGTPVEYADTDIVHDWGATGSYLVRLTVSNVSGGDVTEAVVEVREPQEALPRPDDLAVSVQVLDGIRWEDVSCPVIEASWPWGAPADLGVLTMYASGTLTIRLYDPDRNADPMNPSGKYYPFLAISAELRLTIDEHVVWLGMIERARWSGASSETLINGLDSIALMARIDADVGGPLGLPAQTIAQRMETLMDMGRWPTSRRVIDDDTTQLVAVDIEDQNVWQALRDTALQGLGRVYATQEGDLVYQDRGSSWGIPAPSLVVGCLPPATMPVVDLDLTSGSDLIRNAISVGLIDGQPEEYRSQESIERHGRSTLIAHDMPFTSIAARDDWASFVLQKQDQPSYTMSPLTLRMGETVPAIVAASPQDIWRIRDDSRGGMIDVSGRVLGIDYLITSQQVRIRAYLSRDPDWPGLRSAFQPDAFQPDAFQTRPE